ncbi:MAG: isoleucine--tRNA ligase [Clostridiales bacterium]|nr:isoleucine--tRNA ligase [Clostridiales bacterium]
MDYSETLNLPQTDFPMRGNLPQREPEILEKWNNMDIYRLVGEKNKGKPLFILHDGPPYANGELHNGHVLNKGLKDMVIKYKSMSGFDAPYVPGWDTHGLPIEQKTIKDLGINRHSVSKAEFRHRCAGHALKYVELQKAQFRRLGVRGDWDNPYITLKPLYEAVQIGVFGEMAKKGYIYKGLKPVYWCPSCETALAEAEIEYAPHKSASIYVKFPVREGKGLLPSDSCLVIWTTTPWTIPANLAICLHPDFTYCLIENQGEKLLLAKELIGNFLEATGRQQEYTVLAEYQGSDLELLICKHPLFERDSLIILGEHVTLEAGTGCVHTAPGHGADDFIVGKKYDIPVLSPVDSQGRFTEEAGPFAGLDLNAGNKAVTKALEEAGALLHFSLFEHQYPHCWRCKKPIIYRATEQWFTSIDPFRQNALDEIDKVEWFPAWGRERIYNMIRDRGDWCISRQRTWGVPIPIFYCLDCGETLVNDDTIKNVQDLFREHGSSVWFEREAGDLLPFGFSCPKCGGSNFSKETDTMDVWFDSGSSHFVVLDNWPNHRWPSDLYLEGSDQHRGWFNSSLSLAVAVRGQAPYRQVLTHGFLVDEKGHKQSKSLGNTVDPQEMIDKMGADVLRLWVSSVDYRHDVANSPGIMKQVGETYRKIRNTCRYLLGNLYDFDPQKDQLPMDQLRELDRWAFSRWNRLIEKTREAYESYDFYVVYHAINKFCVVDLSAFYLDVVKDCLYTEVPDSKKRRSVQTVLYHLADGLMRLLVPILPFTSEEIYSYLPKAADSPVSVQLLEMPEVNTKAFADDLEEKWRKILEIREIVSKELEEARQAKKIGHSLDALVELTAPEEHYSLLESLKAELPSIFIVSQIKITKSPELTAQVAPAKGEKCQRCWIYSEDLGEDDGLCPRCRSVMASK